MQLSVTSRHRTGGRASVKFEFELNLVNWLCVQGVALSIVNQQSHTLPHQATSVPNFAVYLRTEKRRLLKDYAQLRVFELSLDKQTQIEGADRSDEQLDAW